MSRLLERLSQILRRRAPEEAMHAGPEEAPERGAPAASDPRQMLIEAFALLRGRGSTLGVGELLAALEALDGGWGTDGPEALLAVARLLWCNSFEEEHELEMVWAALAPAAEDHRATMTRETARSGPALRPPERLKARTPASLPIIPEPVSAVHRPAPEWGVLPVQAPFRPALMEDAPELHNYWPVSRRFMVYAWRYLRRPIADGPADVLDVPATVEQAAQQGFFLAPIYRRRELNHAHLVLLLDQDGSMVPFHHFTRDMVETARHESAIEQVDVYYFHNVPANTLHLDPHRTARVPLDHVLAGCSVDTSLLIVSDGGAARGRRNLSRIRATTEFLSMLKQHTTLVAWLNPMPVDRWPSTSAQIIAHLVPMYQMDPDGLSQAIDVARGQPLAHYG